MFDLDMDVPAQALNTADGQLIGAANSLDPRLKTVDLRLRQAAIELLSVRRVRVLSLSQQVDENSVDEQNSQGLLFPRSSIPGK